MRKRVVKKRVTRPKQRARPKPVSKRRKKVKVLFLCTLGEQASVNRRMSFANMLSKRKLFELFELRTAGVGLLEPAQLRRLLLSQDCIVACDSHAKFRVKHVIARTEKSLLFMEPNTPDEPLRGLLRRIVKEHGIKRPQRKKKQ